MAEAKASRAHEAAGGVPFLRLGINIDHVATVRNARGGRHPDPVRAAHLAIAAGADGITAHLREDRRHITDRDIERLKAELTRPLNFEMAATSEMVAIAQRTAPHACCLVPEKREERTTEGGLDVVRGEGALTRVVGELRDAGIRVSLFIEPDLAAIEMAAKLKAQVVELHTGTYCDAALDHDAGRTARELRRIETGAMAAHSLGLEVHAGHGLTYNTVAGVARLSQVVELNIGHFLVGEALFTGFAVAIGHMRLCMDAARTGSVASGRG